MSISFGLLRKRWKVRLTAHLHCFRSVNQTPTLAWLRQRWGKFPNISQTLFRCEKFKKGTEIQSLIIGKHINGRRTGLVGLWDAGSESQEELSRLPYTMMRTETHGPRYHAFQPCVWCRYWVANHFRNNLNRLRLILIKIPYSAFNQFIKSIRDQTFSNHFSFLWQRSTGSYLNYTEFAYCLLGVLSLRMVRLRDC